MRQVLSPTRCPLPSLRDIRSVVFLHTGRRVWIRSVVDDYPTIVSPRLRLPFVLVDVELAVQKDLRLIGRLVDGPLAPVRLGASVRSVFEDVAPGVAVPAFALESGS